MFIDYDTDNATFADFECNVNNVLKKNKKQ